MKYAIFADIHANLEAYEAVLKDLKKEENLQYFCVGDIIGYGADPVRSIEITRKLNCVSIGGNHEWAVLGHMNIDYFNPCAKQAVLWTKNALKKDDIDYLKTLKLTYENKDFTLVHGTLSAPEEFHYVLDIFQAYKMMQMMNTNISFIGHSHMAGIFVLDKNEPTYLKDTKVKIEKDKKYLINVGSVGQPRDGDWRAAFSLYDKDKGTIEIKRVEYDIKKAQKKILEAGLPEVLAYRLEEGR